MGSSVFRARVPPGTAGGFLEDRAPLWYRGVSREHRRRKVNTQQTVNVEIGEKEWEGVYSNFVIVTHSNAEFIIDFARMLPGVKKAKVFSRIVMTPQSAKALLTTLETNIAKYEKDHGKIPVAPIDPNRQQIGFQTASGTEEKPK
jgi:hypothetical protein